MRSHCHLCGHSWSLSYKRCGPTHVRVGTGAHGPTCGSNGCLAVRLHTCTCSSHNFCSVQHNILINLRHSKIGLKGSEKGAEYVYFLSQFSHAIHAEIFSKLVASMERDLNKFLNPGVDVHGASKCLKYSGLLCVKYFDGMSIVLCRF